jgi:hypothetical protein
MYDPLHRPQTGNQCITLPDQIERLTLAVERETLTDTSGASLIDSGE